MKRHELPEAFRATVDECYQPLARWVDTHRRTRKCFLLGINGAQGTGKSTLADFLKTALESETFSQEQSLAACNVAVLSIDDFYLTRAERKQLAADVHPLLKTRGVPGTHDVAMLSGCLADLRKLEAGQMLALPRFDKARDDRAAARDWPTVSGPVDLIVLEGWCVGSRPEPIESLREPMNALERDADPSGHWRAYVNDQLKGRYADLFAQLDGLVFLQVPDFDAVYRWRLEQERKLAGRTGGSGTELMSAAELAEFIRHYERLTNANLASLPGIADVLIALDENHACVNIAFAP